MMRLGKQTFQIILSALRVIETFRIYIYVCMYVRLSVCVCVCVYYEENMENKQSIERW